MSWPNVPRFGMYSRIILPTVPKSWCCAENVRLPYTPCFSRDSELPRPYFSVHVNGELVCFNNHLWFCWDFARVLRMTRECASHKSRVGLHVKQTWVTPRQQ